MNKKLYITLLLIVFLFLPFATNALNFDPSYIISDEDLTDYKSMTQQEIKNFLNDNGSLETYTFQDIFGNSYSASEIIYNASQEFFINPKYLLTTLQKEQSLVKSTNIKDKDLDWATGFAVCDSCSKDDPAIQIYKGFSNQVYHAARRNRDYINNPNNFKIKKGVEITIDGTKVIPQNQATTNLYIYTPHMIGNRNFFYIWSEWFSKNFPTGTIVKTKDGGDIWLIEGFTKRKITVETAIPSTYDRGNLLLATQMDIQKYDMGIELKYPNYSLLRDEKKNIYILIDDTLKKIPSSITLKNLKLNTKKVINIKNKELENFQIGETITDKTKNPLGNVLKDKKTKELWYVYDNIKHKIENNEILAKYKEKTIITTDSKELNQYAEGVPAKLSDGTLVTSKEYNGPIYIISNGERREIQTEKLFAYLGYDHKNVKKVLNKTLLAHPLSFPLEKGF